MTASCASAQLISQATEESLQKGVILT